MIVHYKWIKDKVMIHIEKLSYAYPGSHHLVFNDFSLNLAGGGIYGLLGKNGTGKSTLLYLLSGLLRPKKGSVSINGRESFHRDPDMLANLFLVPEDFEMPDCSLREFVKVNSAFYPNFSHEMLKECLRDFEVEPGSNLRSLSMGQKKKVYMSYALATNTPLLLMDEPTNGLDIPSKSLFRKVVASHMDDSRTLIISTHQVHDIENLLDHVVIIDQSRVLVDASVGDITSRYAFRTISPDESSKAVYTEPSMGGLAAIMPREEGDTETMLNLELLFNAAVSNAVKLNMES